MTHYINSIEYRKGEDDLEYTYEEFQDYFGNRIAKNLTVYQLHVVPEQFEDFKILMVRLKDILNLSNEHMKELIKKKNNQKPWETLIVSENLNWDQFSKINFYLHELT